MTDLFRLACGITRAAQMKIEVPDYLFEERRDDSAPETPAQRESRARREADRLEPEGCTCPNNGGGDCPWCTIYFDIVEGNVD